MYSIEHAPLELQDAIREFWPEAEWDNAASISYLESAWDAFAVDDSTDSERSLRFSTPPPWLGLALRPSCP